MSLFRERMARSAELQAALDSNDPAAIESVYAKYPELAPQVPTKVLSEGEWGSQQPTIEADPDNPGGTRFIANPVTYSDYLNSLPDTLKGTEEYAANKAQDLVNGIFRAWTANNSVLAGGNRVGEYKEQLEQIKETNPAAYYNAKLSLLGAQAGWDAGQGKTNADTNAQIQNLGLEAFKAGVPVEQISSVVNNSFTGNAKGNAQRIAGIDNGTIGQGALFVGGAMLGAYGIDSALAAAAAANAAGVGGAGADAYMASAGLNPGTFEGAAFTLPEFAGSAGYSSMNDYMNQAGLDAGKFNGFTSSDALNYANNARKIYGVGNNIAKLLGGVGSSSPSGTSAMGNTSQQQIANYLRGITAPVQTNDYLGQIKMNQNPFLFTSPGQTQASEGMYDVSGSNLANALRKR